MQWHLTGIIENGKDFKEQIFRNLSKHIARERLSSISNCSFLSHYYSFWALSCSVAAAFSNKKLSWQASSSAISVYSLINF
jgi:hypothetical protein